jgi:hypothetical protein
MATVVHCDRCLMGGCQVVQVLGRDLCNVCVEQFGSWVDAGTNRQPRKGKSRVYVAAIRRLCASNGNVTPDTLAAVVGTTRTNAHDALRHWKGQGMLKQDVYGAPFTLRVEAAE